MNNLRKHPALILLVDDEVRNLRLVEPMLAAEGYAVRTAANGAEALEAMQAAPMPDLVLLDVMMPGIDGFEVAARLKSDERTRNVPVIMVTALDDRHSRLKALAAGVEDFVSKPVDRPELVTRVRNLLRLKEFSDFLADHARILEKQVQERTDQLVGSYRETILTLVRAASYKDEETGSHVRRISHYTQELAGALELDREYCERMYYASPMHDVGKIAIPDQILQKPGGFTPEEWTVMKTHAALGGTMLEGTD